VRTAGPEASRAVCELLCSTQLTGILTLPPAAIRIDVFRVRFCLAPICIRAIVRSRPTSCQLNQGTGATCSPPHERAVPRSDVLGKAGGALVGGRAGRFFSIW
jgi:hypothetical protein